MYHFKIQITNGLACLYLLITEYSMNIEVIIQPANEVIALDTDRSYDFTGMDVQAWTWLNLSLATLIKDGEVIDAVEYPKDNFTIFNQCC